MGDLFLLGERRIAPFFPLAHGVPRVDERRVVRGIVGVIRNRCDGKMHRRVAAEAKMVARATRSKPSPDQERLGRSMRSNVSSFRIK